MKLLTYSAITFIIFLSSCQRDWLDYSPIDMYSASLTYDDNNASTFLSVAAVSIEPSKFNKSETLDTIASLVKKIKKEHADIQVIVFGELTLSWYYVETEPEAYQRKMAEIIPGKATDFLQNLALENQVNIVIGMTEIDTISNKLYNAQILIQPNHNIIKYRKRNLNQTDKENNLNPGDSLVTVNIDGAKAALFVCSDMQSASISKEIAQAKVDVIFQSLTSTTDLNPSISYVGTQMNTWIVFANRYGNEGYFNYTGFTQIINPLGGICERVVGKNVYVYRKIGIY